MKTETPQTESVPAVVQPPLVRRLREMRDVQGSHGNWNYDAYMHGMYNGMEYALALLEERDPEFKAAPPEWLADRSVSMKPDLGQWLGAKAVAAIESSTNV
jgi:hypothetical protein